MTNNRHALRREEIKIVRSGRRFSGDISRRGEGKMTWNVVLRGAIYKSVGGGKCAKCELVHELGGIFWESQKGRSSGYASTSHAARPPKRKPRATRRLEYAAV